MKRRQTIRRRRQRRSRRTQKHSRPGKKLKPELAKMLHSKIRIPRFRVTITPGDDFYQYINGTWLRTTSMPAYRSSFGVSEEVEAHIQAFLLRDILACQRVAEAGRQPNTDEERLCDAIGRLAMSALRPAKQKHNIEYLKKAVRSMACMRDATDISTTLGHMCRHKVNTVLDIGIYPVSAKENRLVIAPGTLGLPDVSYYNATAPGKTTILYAYTNLVQDLTRRLDLDPVDTAIPLEAKLSAAMAATTNEEDTVQLTFKELCSKCKHIDWTALLKAYGVSEAHLGTLRLEADSFLWLAHLDEQMKTLPIEQWRGLLALHTLLHGLPYLPPPYDDLHSAFFNKMLRGQRHKTPQDILTLNVVMKQMAPYLGHLFVKNYLSPEFKTQATQFIQTVIEAAANRVGSVDWLSASARRTAAKKVRATRIGAAYSEERRPPVPPALQTDNLLANIYLLEAADTDHHLARLLRTPVTSGSIGDESPYTVNAFYFRDTNSIVIPAGSFFWPFFNQDHRGWLGWNYGGLGAVIGHELTHAFDQNGKDYDEKGEMADWWSAADKRAYEERTKALVRLFERQKVLGRSVNGALTLNENLSDLGGLAIALDALKKELAGATAAERRKQLRDFFVSYTVSWRTKEHDERRLQRLILDKHAPVELRVNLIVAQFEEWYEAFDVKTEDALYVPPEARIRIF